MSRATRNLEEMRQVDAQNFGSQYFVPIGIYHHRQSVSSFLIIDTAALLSSDLCEFLLFLGFIVIIILQKRY